MDAKRGFMAFKFENDQIRPKPLPMQIWELRPEPLYIRRFEMMKAPIC